MLTRPIALVLGNGPIEGLAALRRRLARLRPDMVVAADGGSRHARALGFQTLAIVGDMDSLGPQEPAGAGSGVVLLRRPADKDETDLELALLHAFEAGAASAVVIGATGGRLDMTLANLLLLLHPSLQGRRIEMWTGHQTAYLVTSPGGEIPGADGDRVSLIPIGPAATRVTTTGLAYPLDGEDLPIGPGRGISNRILHTPVRVELASGALLVVHTPAGVEG